MRKRRYAIFEHFENTLKYFHEDFITVIFSLYLQLERRFEKKNIVLHGHRQKRERNLIIFQENIKNVTFYIFFLTDMESETQKLYTLVFNIYLLYLTGCPSPENYGKNCSLKCPQNCQDGYCDIVEGTCLACKPGFLGPRCDLGKCFLYAVFFRNRH